MHRDIALVVTDKRRNYLGTKSNYQTKKWFSEILLKTEMNNTKVK